MIASGMRHAASYHVAKGGSRRLNTAIKNVIGEASTSSQPFCRVIRLILSGVYENQSVMRHHLLT